MPGYFDSSILLALLLNDPSAKLAKDFWSKHEERVSSVLFEAECLTVLRRLEQSQQFARSWLAEKEKRFFGYLDEISLQNVDRQVLQIIRNEPKLSDCRTLDAIHVATALMFRGASPDSLSFYTFDKKMKKVATVIGLATE